jgi:uncharacterized protein (DUF885 family)
MCQNKLIEFLSEDPNFCVYTGIDKNLGDLPDPGKNKRITNQGKIKMLTKTLSEIDKEDLSFDDQINYELCELMIEQQRLFYELDLDNYPHNMRMPVASDMVSGPIFMLFINDPRNPKLRLVNIISRLEKVDAFIISYCRNIYEPVERWVEMELDKLKGLPDFFQNITDWAQGVEFKNMDRLNKAVSSANSALKKYELHLKNTSQTKSVFIGEEQMQLVLNSRGIKLTPDELHKIACGFTKKNFESVETYRKILVAKYDLEKECSADEVQKFLARKFKVEKTTDDFSFILKRYESERDKILSYIKESKLFPVMEDQDMHLMQTPDFMAPSIPAGAMMPPTPMREGIKKSLVYLTLTEELLDEHTEISIPGMMIHEGIPGHHLQFAWAAENKAPIRQIFGANDLSEGWTTMLEDYMLDIGYAGDLENEIRFSGKRDIARIGARVAIDLYLMSGDKKYLDIGIECDLSSEDPFVCAGNLLQAITGFVDGRVQGELNWYSQERGYPLSYLTGNHLVWELKEKFSILKKESMNTEDIDREFHKRFLEAGNMPVSILEKIILR